MTQYFFFSEEHGPVEEDVYLTAVPEDVCKMSGISSNQIAPSSSIGKELIKSGEIPSCDDVDNWFKYIASVKKVQKMSTKLAPLLEPDDLRKQNELA